MGYFVADRKRHLDYCNYLQCWRSGAFDEEPQHECNLSEEGGLTVCVHPILILWQECACQAQDDPGETGEGEPDAEEPGQESRLIDEECEGKKPEAPEYFGDNESATVQMQKQHSERIALRLVDCR